MHQEYLRQHPEVVAEAESTLQQAPGTDWLKGTLSGQGRGTSGQRARLIRCLWVSAVAGSSAGLAIRFLGIDWSLLGDGSLACGTVILVVLIAGAVVGAIVGDMVQGREDRVRGAILGAIVSGVAAFVSWAAAFLFELLEWLGA